MSKLDIILFVLVIILFLIPSPDEQNILMIPTTEPPVSAETYQPVPTPAVIATQTPVQPLGTGSGGTRPAPSQSSRKTCSRYENYRFESDPGRIIAPGIKVSAYGKHQNVNDKNLADLARYLGLSNPNWKTLIVIGGQEGSALHESPWLACTLYFEGVQALIVTKPDVSNAETWMALIHELRHAYNSHAKTGVNQELDAYTFSIAFEGRACLENSTNPYQCYLEMLANRNSQLEGSGASWRYYPLSPPDWTNLVRDLVGLGNPLLN